MTVYRYPWYLLLPLFLGALFFFWVGYLGIRDGEFLGLVLAGLGAYSLWYSLVLRPIKLDATGIERKGLFGTVAIAWDQIESVNQSYGVGTTKPIITVLSKSGQKITIRPEILRYDELVKRLPEASQ